MEKRKLGNPFQFPFSPLWISNWSTKNWSWTYTILPTAAVCWGCSSWTGARSAQPSPWIFPGPMGDPVCQGRHLRRFVRAAVTAPNAPNTILREYTIFPLFKAVCEHDQYMIGNGVRQNARARWRNRRGQQWTRGIYWV